MKLKALSAAVALCALAGVAHAIDPTAAAGFDTIGAAVNINAGGATAQDKAVLGHVLTNLCTGNIDLFTNNTAAQVAAGTFVGTNDTAVSCDTTETRLDFDANGDTDKADNTTFMFRKLS